MLVNIISPQNTEVPRRTNSFSYPRNNSRY